MWSKVQADNYQQHCHSLQLLTFPLTPILGMHALYVSVCERQMRKILNMGIYNYLFLGIWDFRFPLYCWEACGKGKEVGSGWEAAESK